jgi:DNA topoisomerase-1
VSRLRCFYWLRHFGMTPTHAHVLSLQQRVRPEQITINIGKEAPVPEPPAGHKWGKIIHDDTVTWLAMWKENINGAFKYVFLAAGSSLKGQSDFKKFEKARELKVCIHRCMLVGMAGERFD